MRSQRGHIGPERHLATVLFTDIVGSTEKAAELRDRGWRALLEEHHGLVRRELQRFRGREVNTAGDGFLATFDDPEPAILCACAIRDRVRDLGIEIRSGLHMGQVERMGGTVGGIGVHIGARVAARAGPGEVLVSSTVRDAVAGSDFGFEDRGVHALKGVPGEWRIFAVSELPEAAALARGPRLTRRRPLGLVAGLLLAVGIAAYLVGSSLDRAGEEGAPAAGDERMAQGKDGGASPSRSKGPPQVTLAVLPFHPLNSPDEIGFLGVGIPDAIITKLANARQMRLRPTSAILTYESQRVNPQEAGQALASDYVLTGTLQEAGERFRASVQLVRVGDGATVWGERYDLPRSDLLVLQDSIAAKVAATLEIQMTAAERERLYRRYTDNVAAYELYLKGRSQLVRYKTESTRAAVEAFEKALRLDPDYALAHAGLAMASALTSRDASEAEAKDWVNRAQAEVDRALKLDPGLAEAHEARAAVYRNTEFDWEGTIRESRRALELNPNLELPHVYLSAAFYHLGLLDLAEAEARTALEINPVAVEPRRLRGNAALISGRFEEAVSLLEEVQRLSDHPVAGWYLAQAYYYAGDPAKAEASLTGLRASGSTERRVQATLASFLAARGEKGRAEELLAQVRAASKLDHHVAYSLGAAYAQLGQKGEAHRWLAQAAETGLPCYPWYALDPLLRPLKGDPDFERLLAGLRTSWEAAKVRYGA